MSKQERVVCAAVKVCITNDNYSEPVVVAGIDYQAINNSGLLSAVGHPTYCNMNHLGFITNKNRFVGAKEAMKIAIKSGQYPDYELMKRKALEEIGHAKENEKHNESVGILGFRLYVADIPKLVARVKELDKLLECNYLLPEDLY